MSNKFFEFLENILTLVAGKVVSQRYICAIRDGFIGSTPFMIVGSFLLVFAFPPFSPDTTMSLGILWLDLSKQYFGEIMMPFHVTMEIMSCYICTCIAYNLAKTYKLDGLSTSMLALMTFLLTSAPMAEGNLPVSFLGGTGIFTAILISLLVTELVYFLNRKNIFFRMPDQVPEKIRESFNLLIPAAIIILTIYSLNLFVHHEFGVIIPGAIMAFFQPLISASDTLPAILLAVLLAYILLFSGIHGAAIVSGIMASFYLPNLGANQEALAARVELPHIFIE